jgi:poly(3-hydroxybutyrate) depolymerase
MHPTTFPALLAALASFGGLVIAAPSAGCTSDSTVPALETRITTQLAVNTNRSYMYWLPPTYDHRTPAPVILSYHGIAQSPTKQANLDQFGNVRFNQDTIAVWPQAIKPPGEREVMFQGPRTATEDDITFTMEILDELEQNFCVDTSRIYASGKSEGGGFAGMLACNETSTARIAAFAPVSGAFYPGTSKSFFFSLVRYIMNEC